MSHEVFWMNSAHEKRREVLEMLGLVEPIDVTWFFDVATVLQDCGEAGRLPLYRKAWRLIGAKMANDSETRDAFKSVVQLSDNKRDWTVFLFSIPEVKEALNAHLVAEEIAREEHRYFMPWVLRRLRDVHGLGTADLGG
jgi:hypothetical protein